MNPLKSAKRRLEARAKARFAAPMLPEGASAPTWSLAGHDGSQHAPNEDWHLLVFYPADDTPGCSAQLADFETHRQDLSELGCRVFGVNPAPVHSHATFAERLGLGFPLLVDTDLRLAKAYGATFTLPGSGPRILRSVFLINPAGVVRLANRGAPSVAAIARSIRALQQATRAGM